MMDFIKAYPSVTKEEYMWSWSVPQIKLAAFDFSHVVYLNDNQKLKRKAKKVDVSQLNDLGIPIFEDKQINNE